ncbi:MAG TPA: hypothetical protein VMR00_00130 [Streptosporangiaceae bacterium]|nr:hypothetical protein [Streptosporangiaceae bacterium]
MADSMGVLMMADVADGADTTLSLALTFCPECELPAEVTDRFVLPSTNGPVDHVALRCLARHHFRMPSEMLRSVAAEPRQIHQPSGLDRR